MKKFVISLLLCICCLTLFGCTPLFESKEQTSKRLLETAYGEPFEIIKLRGGSPWWVGFNNGWFDVYAKPIYNPNLCIKASINNTKTAISSNYAAKIVCNNLSLLVEENLDDKFSGDFYVYSEVLFEPNIKGNQNLTLEEFMQETPNNTFTIYVFYTETDTEPDEFYYILKSSLDYTYPINGKIYLYGVDNSTLQYACSYLRQYDRPYDEIMDIMELYDKGSYSFENSELVITEEDFVKEYNENKLEY